MRYRTLGYDALLRVLATAIGLALLQGATASADLILSSDVDVVLAGTAVADEQIAVDDQAGSVWSTPLGALPSNVSVDGYHRRDDGVQLFSLDTTTSLSANGSTIVVSPADVVRWDGVEYVLELDAAATGIPGGVNVDAVSESVSGDLVLSFSTTLNLGGLVVEDEDLVRFDGGTFATIFDGSAQGVSPALDLDGADATGDLVLSFDGSGSVGGQVFDDEDALRFEEASGSWTVVYDGSVEHSGWTTGADLTALRQVPEPGLVLGLMAGVAGLAWRQRRRGF